MIPFVEIIVRNSSPGLQLTRKLDVTRGFVVRVYVVVGYCGACKCSHSRVNIFGLFRNDSPVFVYTQTPGVPVPSMVDMYMYVHIHRDQRSTGHTHTRARSHRSFAITYHYSAWLLELQPRAMFATRLPCTRSHSLSLSLSLLPPSPSVVILPRPLIPSPLTTSRPFLSCFSPCYLTFTPFLSPASTIHSPHLIIHHATRSNATASRNTFLMYRVLVI